MGPPAPARYRRRRSRTTWGSSASARRPTSIWGGEAVGVIPTPGLEGRALAERALRSHLPRRRLLNMIIGQGDVLVTPLQVACAYAGVATGRIMRPHLLKEVRNSEGETVVTYEPVVERTPEVTEAHLAYVRDALHGMVQGSLTPWRPVQRS